MHSHGVVVFGVTVSNTAVATAVFLHLNSATLDLLRIGFYILMDRNLSDKRGFSPADFQVRIL